MHALFSLKYHIDLRLPTRGLVQLHAYPSDAVTKASLIIRGGLFSNFYTKIREKRHGTRYVVSELFARYARDKLFS